MYRSPSTSRVNKLETCLFDGLVKGKGFVVDMREDTAISILQSKEREHSRLIMAGRQNQPMRWKEFRMGEVGRTRLLTWILKCVTGAWDAKGE